MAAASWSERKRDHQISLFDFPEEIVAEILLRMPPKRLFRFKCASKRCKSMVSDPKFAKTYLKSTSPFSSLLKGMLYPFIYHSRLWGSSRCPWQEGHKVIVADDGCRELVGGPHPHHMHHKLLFYVANRSYSRFPRILASNDGLILFQIQPYNIHYPGIDTRNSLVDLCIFNPLTKQFLRLGSVRFTYARWMCGFATQASEINGSYNIAFKVVLINHDFKFTTIDILSSDTISWVDASEVIGCPQVAPQNLYRAQDFCYKGILHWFDQDTRTIVTYDPFNKPDSFGHIRLPNVVGSGKNIVRSMNLIHLDDEDLLKCCEIERCSDSDHSLLVWKLVDYDKGEWDLERRCSISSLCGVDGLLRECRQLIAPDPLNPQAYCYVFARDNRVTAFDLGSGKEEDVEISTYNFESIPKASDTFPLVPFMFCPWSWSSPPCDPIGNKPGKLAKKPGKLYRKGRSITIVPGRY